MKRGSLAEGGQQNPITEDPQARDPGEHVLSIAPRELGEPIQVLIGYGLVRAFADLMFFGHNATVGPRQMSGTGFLRAGISGFAAGAEETAFDEHHWLPSLFGQPLELDR
ncbi:hypothetical protein [Nocardia fusca]|uniref:hypothetical protein n=1 Tax=Nocardia fusca TaxID=941183 RepID=UPI0007A7325C|nr:hypothetical protein [Nocardia fusca]